MPEILKRLTAYEFACGFVERIEKNNTRITTWKEHGVYHVRAHEFEGRGRLEWNSFRTLQEARKDFARLRRLYHKGKAIVLPSLMLTSDKYSNIGILHEEA